jgi:hypothetical protein
MICIQGESLLTLLPLTQGADSSILPFHELPERWSSSCLIFSAFDTIRSCPLVDQPASLRRKSGLADLVLHVPYLSFSRQSLIQCCFHGAPPQCAFFPWRFIQPLGRIGGMPLRREVRPKSPMTFNAIPSDSNLGIVDIPPLPRIRSHEPLRVSVPAMASTKGVKLERYFDMSAHTQWNQVDDTSLV